MKTNRVLGWIITESKQEAIEALEKMLENVKLCDDDVGMVNMHIFKEEATKEGRYEWKEA